MTGLPAVIAIAGIGRSGSTLLERLLVERAGAFGLGEVRYAWERGFANDELCSCGEHFSRCDFWSRVAGDVASGDGRLREIVEIASRVNRNRRLPMWLWTRLASRQFRDDAHAYTDALDDLYRAVVQHSGSRLLVDSSKIPTHVLALSRLRDVHVVTVHLVRDSRAVAHSWSRRRVRPEVTGDEEFMDQPSPVNVALTYDSQNLALELADRSVRTYLRVRYEDAVRDPAAVIDRIVEKAAVAPEHSSSVDARPPSERWHSVAGNPMRFGASAPQLTPDEEWASAMPTGSRLLVTATTLPLLLRYGYPVRGRATNS